MTHPEHKTIVMPDTTAGPVPEAALNAHELDLFRTADANNRFLIGGFVAGENTLPTATLGLTDKPDDNAMLLAHAYEQIEVGNHVRSIADSDDPRVTYVIARPEKGSSKLPAGLALVSKYWQAPGSDKADIIQVVVSDGSLPPRVQGLLDAEAAQAAEAKRSEEAAREAATAKQQADMHEFVEHLKSQGPKPLTTRERLGRAATNFFKAPPSSHGKHGF